MSTKYKATTTEEAYFITITIVGWIDVFTRVNQKNNILNALNYCQKYKGLEIYAYVLMSSHIHILCKATLGFVLSDVIRDFKKFTSKKILQTIKEEPESRREWLLDYFQKACQHLKREQHYKVWQDGYHAELAESNWFIKQKIDYSAGSFGLVVIGDGSCSRGCGFESQHCTLDGHFSHIFFVKI